MNRYEKAVHEVRSVLGEWTVLQSYGLAEALSKAVVERLVAQGLIQSTNPDDLVEAPSYGDMESES